MDVVRGHFRPEFLNRLDEIIMFHRLAMEHMAPIVAIQVKRVQKLLDDRKITLELTDGALRWLGRVGYDPVYGARPLKRGIEARGLRFGHRDPLLSVDYLALPRASTTVIEGPSGAGKTPTVGPDGRGGFLQGPDGEEVVTRPTEEAGYLIAGELELHIDDQMFHLTAGDAFRFDHARFRWRNPGTEPAVAIWVIAPPVY